jgi:hypothetical protein
VKILLASVVLLLLAAPGLVLADSDREPAWAIRGAVVEARTVTPIPERRIVDLGKVVMAMKCGQPGVFCDDFGLKSPPSYAPGVNLYRRRG